MNSTNNISYKHGLFECYIKPVSIKYKKNKSNSSGKSGYNYTQSIFPHHYDKKEIITINMYGISRYIKHTKEMINHILTLNNNLYVICPVYPKTWDVDELNNRNYKKGTIKFPELQIGISGKPHINQSILEGVIMEVKEESGYKMFKNNILYIGTYKVRNINHYIFDYNCDDKNEERKNKVTKSQKLLENEIKNTQNPPVKRRRRSLSDMSQEMDKEYDQRRRGRTRQGYTWSGREDDRRHMGEYRRGDRRGYDKRHREDDRRGYDRRHREDDRRGDRRGYDRRHREDDRRKRGEYRRRDSDKKWFENLRRLDLNK